MNPKVTGLLLACVLLLLVAACVPLPPERLEVEATPSTPSSLPSPTPESVPVAPTEPSATGTPIAQPTVGSVPVHPTSTRTGIAEVDRVIEAVLGGERDAVRSLLRVLSTPCTTREGLGGPPKCNPGEIEGTTVQAFPVGGPEGTFVRPAEMDRLLPLQVAGLYAVYTVPGDAYREDYWPAGDYGVVFLRPDQTFLIALVTADGIVRLDYPAIRSPAELSEWMGSDVVLAPPGS